jgi:hypothetical protein
VLNEKKARKIHFRESRERAAEIYVGDQVQFDLNILPPFPARFVKHANSQYYGLDDTQPLTKQNTNP